MEEVPEQYRDTVQNALSSANPIGGHGKITVNGVSYDSVEAMPPDVRGIYEQALAKAGTIARSTGTPLAAPQSGAPVQEGGISRRTIIILILLAALAVLVKYFTPR
jgi:hypothetical protein